MNDVGEEFISFNTVFFIELLFKQEDPSKAHKEKEELDRAIALSLAEDLKRRNRMIS